MFFCSGFCLPSRWDMFVKHGETSFLWESRGLESAEWRRKCSLHLLHVHELVVCLRFRKLLWCRKLRYYGVENFKLSLSHSALKPGETWIWANSMFILLFVIFVMWNQMLCFCCNVVPIQWMCVRTQVHAQHQTMGRYECIFTLTRWRHLGTPYFGYHLIPMYWWNVTYVLLWAHFTIVMVMIPQKWSPITIADLHLFEAQGRAYCLVWLSQSNLLQSVGFPWFSEIG